MNFKVKVGPNSLTWGFPLVTFTMCGAEMSCVWQKLFVKINFLPNSSFAHIWQETYVSSIANSLRGSNVVKLDAFRCSSGHHKSEVIIRGSQHQQWSLTNGKNLTTCVKICFISFLLLTTSIIIIIIVISNPFSSNPFPDRGICSLSTLWTTNQLPQDHQNLVATTIVRITMTMMVMYFVCYLT